MIAFMYDRVRTSSFCSHGNNLVSKCSILKRKGWWGEGSSYQHLFVDTYHRERNNTLVTGS